MQPKDKNVREQFLRIGETKDVDDATKKKNEKLTKIIKSVSSFILNTGIAGGFFSNAVNFYFNVRFRNSAIWRLNKPSQHCSLALYAMT